jgi:adenylate kinase
MGPNANSPMPGPVIFLGAPGAGKGTQAREIAKLLGIPHISTGVIFRENVEKKTPLGLAAKSVIEAGGLVRDDLVNGMVRNRVCREDCQKGFLLDGYPRTLPQAEALKGILKEIAQKDPVVVNLSVSYNEIVQRLSGRRVCPVCHRTYNLSSQPPARDSVCDDDGASLQHRSDDREEAIHERLSGYEAQTAPLIEFYKKGGRFFEVDANRSPQEITGKLSRLLQAP